MRVSSLMRNPKSKILEKGYINVYSKLPPQEERGLFYKREYKKTNRNWNDTMIILCQFFTEALERLKIQNGKKELIVLDAGCGHGNYVIDEFRHKITWACGVDLDKKFTEKNVCLDEIKYANLDKIPYGDNTFDVVLSLWVLEHLKDPTQVFQEIRRVLKPGGFFIFATPNKKCLLISLRRFAGSGMLVPCLNRALYGRKEEDVFSTFYRANDLDTLKHMLKKVGFEDTDLKLNYDPSYTSFSRLTFKISKVMNHFFEKLAPQFYKQHVVGFARKPMR